MTDYVHGYSERESVRLSDQARTLSELLHHDSIFPPESRILEAGCGIGAQTVNLARQNPQVHITSFDISADSLEKAKTRVAAEGFNNVSFLRADIFSLPFEPESFDHIFVCFVLEHLPDPIKAIKSLKSFLKPGGSFTAIEGDHGSTYFYPPSPFAQKAVQCLIDLQAGSGGDSLIGRRLYPLLCEAGFMDVKVTPRMVYVDASRPEYVEGFIRSTFTAMIEGLGDLPVCKGMVSEDEWRWGIKDLYRTAEKDGVFCYCFFKGIGYK